MTNASWIYVCGTPAPSMAPVKIGYTTVGPENRLEQIRTPGSVIVPAAVDLATIELLYAAEAEAWMERALHEHFREYRVEGEWFSLDPAVARREVRMAIAEILRANERMVVPKPVRRSIVVAHELSTPVPTQRSNQASHATQHRLLFERWTQAGFTEDQALRMVVMMTIEQAKATA